MKRRITRLAVLQTGKLLAVLYAFVSVLMLPFMLIALLAGGGRAVAPMLGMLVLYPIMGFVGGILVAAIYNLAARCVGGLEVSVDAIETE